MRMLSRFRPAFPKAARFPAAFLAAASLLAAAGCGGAAAGSGGQGRAGKSPLPTTVDSQVLAVLNGEDITVEDLSDRDRLQLAKLKSEYHTEAHGLLEAGAVRVARDRLLLAAAQDQGMTLNQYYSREIGVPEVSDNELRRIYEQNRRQFGGRSLEEVGTDLRRQITNQKLNREIELAGNRLLGEAEWDLQVPAYRVEIETDGHASLGPEDAPVKVVVFSDFECPFCRRFNGGLDRLREEAEYAEQVQVVFRHYPLRALHPQAQKAHEASVCAEEQGKFWEYHDALWANENLALDTLEQHAVLLGLDSEEFAQCLNSGRHYQRIQADFEAARDLGQSGTPAVFVNGRYVGGAIPFERLKAEIDRDIAAAEALN